MKIDIDKFLEFLKELKILNSDVEFSNQDKERIKSEIMRIKDIGNYLKSIDDEYLYLNIDVKDKEELDNERTKTEIEKKVSDLAKRRSIMSLKKS